MKYTLCCAILLLLMGCADYLEYRPSLERQRQQYYTKSLQYENQIQQQGIEGVQRSLSKLSQLSYVLYHRLPNLRARYAVLSANLKLTRLEKSLATLDRMKEHIKEGFSLIFTRKDLISKPLQLNFTMEMEYMSEFTMQLNELRALVNYMERFRREALIMGDLPEEKLELAPTSLIDAEKNINEVIYQQIPKPMRNIGIIITGNPDFTFGHSNIPEIKKEADKEAEKLLLKAGNKGLLEDVTNYSYEFDEELEQFNMSLTVLENSVQRFKTAIEEFRKDTMAQGNSNIDEQIATQLDTIIAIMDDMLKRIKKIYLQASAELQAVVGNERNVVDESLWAQIKTETDAESTQKKFDYYVQAVLAVNDFAKHVLAQEESESAWLKARLDELDKTFNAQNGLWATKYQFLNAQSQQKVSFATTKQNLSARIEKFRIEMSDALRALWRSAQVKYQKQGKKVPYTMTQKGFLAEGK